MSKVVTSVIIPTYNEEEGLPLVLRELTGAIDNSYEVIIVDKHSTDKTLEIVSKYPSLIIVHQTNQGKGEALKMGIEKSRGKNIVWIDADNTYPAKTIPQITKALDKYDLVVCSRVFGRNNIPKLNRVGNHLFRILVRGIYGFKYDPFTGLNGIKKECLEKMELTFQRFTIEPEICIKATYLGLKILEIPIEYRGRVGVTKLNSIKAGFENLLTILRLIFWRPK